MKAVLRRTFRRARHGRRIGDVIEFNGLKVSLDSKVCHIDDKEVKMPRKEFEILALLISNRGKVFHDRKFSMPSGPRT